MDVTIDELIIEEDRPEHIAKHNVTIEEVLEIVNGDYVFIDGKLGRWLLIGERKQKNAYGLVTARPSSKEERSFYKEYITQKGGAENG